jgi:hypothetical protein
MLCVPAAHQPQQPPLPPCFCWQPGDPPWHEPSCCCALRRWRLARLLARWQQRAPLAAAVRWLQELLAAAARLCCCELAPLLRWPRLSPQRVKMQLRWPQQCLKQHRQQQTHQPRWWCLLHAPSQPRWPCCCCRCCRQAEHVQGLQPCGRALQLVQLLLLLVAAVPVLPPLLLLLFLLPALLVLLLRLVPLLAAVPLLLLLLLPLRLAVLLVQRSAASAPASGCSRHRWTAAR